MEQHPSFHLFSSLLILILSDNDKTHNVHQIFFQQLKFLSQRGESLLLARRVEVERDGSAGED